MGNELIPLAKWRALEGVFACWARNGTWVGRGDDYSWTPAQACQRFEPDETAVQAPRTCERLRGKMVLFVGDSVQRQIWSSFNKLSGKRLLVKAPPLTKECKYQNEKKL